MDDESFDAINDVVADMSENGTNYVTRTEKQDEYSHYTSFDMGVVTAGIAGIIAGGLMYIWDKRKLKKEFKK
jgi:hypothetical protein